MEILIHILLTHNAIAVVKTHLLGWWFHYIIVVVKVHLFGWWIEVLTVPRGIHYAIAIVKTHLLGWWIEKLQVTVPRSIAVVRAHLLCYETSYM